MKKLKTSFLLLFLALGFVATPCALFAADSDSDSDDWIFGDSRDASADEGVSGEGASSLALALGEKLEKSGYLAILSERFGGRSKEALQIVCQRMAEWWQNTFPQEDPKSSDWFNFESDDTFGAGEAFRRELLRIEQRVLPEGTYVRLVRGEGVDGGTVWRPEQVLHVSGDDALPAGQARHLHVALPGSNGNDSGAPSGNGTLTNAGASGSFQFPQGSELTLNGSGGGQAIAFLPPGGNGVTPLDPSVFDKQLEVPKGVNLPDVLRASGVVVDTGPDVEFSQQTAQLQDGQAPPLLGAGVPATTTTRAITSGGGGSEARIPIPRITINGEGDSNGESATRGLNLGGENKVTESPLSRHRRRSRPRTPEVRAAALDARNRNANLKMNGHREVEAATTIQAHVRGWRARRAARGVTDGDGTGSEGGDGQVDHRNDDGDNGYTRGRSGSGDSSLGDRSRSGSGLGNPAAGSAAEGGGGGVPGDFSGIENQYNYSKDAALVFAATIGVVVLAYMAAKKYGPGAKVAVKRFCARNDLGRFVTKAWWLSKGKGFTSFSQRQLSSLKDLLRARFPWTRAAV